MCLPLRYYRDSFSLALTRELGRGMSLYFLSLFLVHACSKSFSLSLRVHTHLSPFHSRLCLSPTDTLFLLPSRAFSFTHSPSLTSSFPLSLSIYLSFNPSDFCLNPLHPPLPSSCPRSVFNLVLPPPSRTQNQEWYVKEDGAIERNHDVDTIRHIITHEHEDTRAHAHTHTGTRTHIHTHTNTCTHIHTHVCVCTRTKTHR